MNRRYKRKEKKYKAREVILKHIENNIKEYLIVTIILFIGIIIGVIFINNASQNQSSEITDYINSFTQELKDKKDINTLLFLKDSIKKNILLSIFLWFMGSTVIGISIVYITICFRGFCLGYTVSSIILTLGVRKRNYIFNISSFVTKHHIYSSYISAWSKWNETTQFNNAK